MNAIQLKKIKFLNDYAESAHKSELNAGVPALVTLAQAAIESAWGEKAPGNNFFGIKADRSWAGPTQTIITREVFTSPGIKNAGEVISITKRKDGKYDYKIAALFRAYATPEEGFVDHGKFLKAQNRYKPAFEALEQISDADDRAITLTRALAFAKEIAKAGYATDPNYYNTLASIIRNLHSLLSE